jgi:ATP-dependent DNA helicase RecG
VLKEYKKLSEEIFPDLKVSYIHGKLKSGEKQQIMQDFGSGKIDILVSTSVVEVGVNIPNASVMMIEDAEKFGLAQLHQFRGRVGRSSYQSYCFLFSDSSSQLAQSRLQFFEKTLDGFALAEFDLETRGPGEVYGTSQSGMMNLRLASLRDTDIIRQARELARGIEFKKYPSIIQKMKEWDSKVHLE